MDETKTEGVPGAQHDRETPEEVIARRKAAKRALLKRVAKQPAMNIGKWTRDELYER